jgi:hypothetical protein
MSKLAILLLAAGAVLTAEPTQVFTGVITESMCKMDHKMMNISPDDKCIRDCVKSSSGHTKYVLLGQGKQYLLSDQETPAQFAAKKVKVMGVFYPKTGVIAVERIEAAN